jgi:hypothetical protein
LHCGEFLARWRLVVGGVVGEDCGAVEGAVVFREVEPALVANPLWSGTADADTNDVSGGVEQAFAEVNEFLVPHALNEGIDGHGVDEFLVVDRCAVTKENAVPFSIDELDTAVFTEASLCWWDGFGYLNPDVASAAVGWEAECRIGTPVTGGLLEDGVLGDELEVGGSHTFAEPRALHLSYHVSISCPRAYASDISISHLRRRYSPDLIVVGPHKAIGQPFSLCPQDPLIKVFWLGVGHPRLHSGIDHTLQACNLIFLWQHGNVVLERVGNPDTFVADVRDALVVVPIGVVGEGFVDTVVEVFVVGEDDVAADVVELLCCLVEQGVSEKISRLTKPSLVTSVEARPPGVSLESTIIHDGPS